MATLIAIGYVAFLVSGWTAPVQTAAQQRPARAAASTIAGTASLSGTVTAAKPFKAAQVYIRNVDKSIGYMVYTNAGQFRSTALVPGNYEITVRAKDLSSEVQELVLKAGDTQSVNVASRDSNADSRPGGTALNSAETGSIAGADASLTYQNYNEIYPDMDKITTLGAFYVNGSPGYPFEVTSSTTTRGAEPTNTVAARKAQ